MKNKPYTLKEIEMGLRNEGRFYARGEEGDISAIILLADSKLALEKAEPTEAQLQAVELVWRQGHTLHEAGEKLGVSREAVRFNLQLLSVKLSEVVSKWEEREKKEEREGKL